jgi:hypothetical protein
MEEPKLSLEQLEQLIKDTFKPKTSISIIMVILSILAFILYNCKSRIMQCLKRAGLRKPNQNKPTRLYARHQQEVKEQCKTIGQDVNKIRWELSVVYKTLPRPPLLPPQPFA